MSVFHILIRQMCDSRPGRNAVVQKGFVVRQYDQKYW